MQLHCLWDYIINQRLTTFSDLRYSNFRFPSYVDNDRTNDYITGLYTYLYLYIFYVITERSINTLKYKICF